MAKILDIKKRIRSKKRVQKYKDESFEVRDAREKEFFIVDDAYMNGYARICGPFASLVYILLCRHAGKDQNCFPSIELIISKLKLSRPTVLKALKILEHHNIIKIDRLKGEPNIYTLTNKKHWKKMKMADNRKNDVTPTEQAISTMKGEPGCEGYPKGTLP